MNPYKIEYDPAEFWRLADCGTAPDWSEIEVNLERVDSLVDDLAELIPYNLRPSLWRITPAPLAIARASILAALFVAFFVAGLLCGQMIGGAP